jgi:predicted nucleic-acid-binding Zn-ribbon protein
MKIKIEDYYSINDRARCSKCGTREFFKSNLYSNIFKPSKVQKVLMCRCKGCDDIHTWSSRISSDEWRKKVIDKILDNGNR